MFYKPGSKVHRLANRVSTFGGYSTFNLLLLEDVNTSKEQLERNRGASGYTEAPKAWIAFIAESPSLKTTLPDSSK